MKIIASCKILADDQDIVANPGQPLDYSKAHQVVSEFDLNAIEAAAQLAAANEGTVVAVSVAEAAAGKDSKLKKNILARGVDELFMTADDACKGLDAHATAAELAKLVAKVGEFDLVVCGDGSADLYAQQTDVQLADALGLPCVTAVSKMEMEGGKLVCERMLETQVETVEVALPAVVSVIPDIAQPRICGMKDILAAGKKPASIEAGDAVAAATVDVVEEKAPEQADRKLEIFDAANEGDVEKFAAAVKAAL